VTPIQGIQIGEGGGMPRMTRFSKISVVGVGAVATLTIALVYGLFHGYFDHGQFEITQFQWSSTRDQVAMIAERSDRQALGGLEYYVLIGNHLFTPAELRHAYYSNAVVFNASSDCLALQWEGQNKLTIKCKGSTIDTDDINVQRHQINNVAISYENIALKAANSPIR
jgi:hypothetical protein